MKTLGFVDKRWGLSTKWSTNLESYQQIINKGLLGKVPP